MKIKWLWTMKKAQKPLIWDTFDITNKHSAKFFEIPYSMKHTKIVNGDIYFDELLIEFITDAIREKVKEDVNYPSKIAKKLYELEKDVVNKTSKVRSIDLKKVSNEELIKLFDESFYQISMIECFMSFRGTVQLCDVLTEIIKQAIAAKLNKIGKLELLDEYFLLMSTPKIESYVALLQNELFRIGAMIQDGVDERKVEEEIKKLHKEYSWAGCVMFEGEHISLEKFRNDVKEKLNLNCKDELERYEKERNTREEKIKKLIDELEFSDKEKIHLENLRDWYFLRTYAKDNVSKVVADAMLILYEIANRTGIDRLDIPFLRKKEIEKIFETPKNELIKKIEERKIGWGARVLDQQIDLFTGNDIKEIEEKEEDIFSVKEIKGQVASRGKIEGVVKFIKDASEIDKVKKNDILVTSMTTTDFTPILDKISGIITDEGGLTCHAAIVSRELGIPCIIGTKIATRLLKTGDFILLDAEKGIIKKLH